MKIILLTLSLITLSGISLADDDGRKDIHFFRDYVTDKGEVNYAAIKNNIYEEFKIYNMAFGKVTKPDFETRDRDAQIAFYINAYNSFTIQAVLEKYPVKSIKDIPDVWKTKRWELLGEKLSLDDIEHEILRKKYKAPKIHMGLVCASIGCPPIRKGAFRGPDLGEQLDEQAKLFFSNEKNFSIDRKNKVVYLSPLFDWFGDDFIESYSTKYPKHTSEKMRAVLNFVSNYISDSDASYLSRKKYKIQWLDYDWNLNDSISSPVLKNQ